MEIKRNSLTSPSKIINDLETVTVGSTLVKNSDHCEYLGVTIDKHLGFQTQVKKVLKNMAVGIKTVELSSIGFQLGYFLCFSTHWIIPYCFSSKLVLLCCSH